MRVYHGSRPYEFLDPPVAVLYLRELLPAPLRVLDPVWEKNVRTNEHDVPIDRVYRPIPFTLWFHVGVYANEYEDYLAMTERVIAHWTEHCIVPIEGKPIGVGIDLKSITDQNAEDFGVYGRVLVYTAWVWLASAPKEFPEILRGEWALDTLTVAIDWQQQYPDSGGFPPDGVGQRVIVTPP